MLLSKRGISVRKVVDRQNKKKERKGKRTSRKIQTKIKSNRKSKRQNIGAAHKLARAAISCQFPQSQHSLKWRRETHHSSAGRESPSAHLAHRSQLFTTAAAAAADNDDSDDDSEWHTHTLTQCERICQNKQTLLVSTVRKPSPQCVFVSNFGRDFSSGRLCAWENRAEKKKGKFGWKIHRTTPHLGGDLLFVKTSWPHVWPTSNPVHSVWLASSAIATNRRPDTLSVSGWWLDRCSSGWPIRDTIDDKLWVGHLVCENACLGLIIIFRAADLKTISLPGLTCGWWAATNDGWRSWCCCCWRWW